MSRTRRDRAPIERGEIRQLIRFWQLDFCGGPAERAAEVEHSRAMVGTQHGDLIVAALQDLVFRSAGDFLVDQLERARCDHIRALPAY